jgi:hypothetical protein
MTKTTKGTTFGDSISRDAQGRNVHEGREGRSGTLTRRPQQEQNWPVRRTAESVQTDRDCDEHPRLEQHDADHHPGIEDVRVGTSLARYG